MARAKPLQNGLRGFYQLVVGLQGVAELPGRDLIKFNLRLRLQPQVQAALPGVRYPGCHPARA